MRWLEQIFARRRRYRELSASIHEHLDEKIADLMETGMSRKEAEHAARREFGNVALIEQRSREVWQGPALESIWTDLRYAARQLRRSPGLAIAVIATLSLGIGVNTAIFAVFGQVLLQMMPVHQAQKLVLLHEHSRYETGTLNIYAGDQSLAFSYSAYQALRKNTALTGLAVSALAPVTITSPTQAENASIQLVSGNYFDVMGLKPELGRLLAPADDQLHAANPVAVMSDAYWRAHFGADPSILNRTLRLNGSPVTIVGIVQNRGLVDSSPVALFVPVTLQDTLVPVFGNPFTDHLNCWLNLVGRLAPGVTPAQAEDQLNVLWWNWRRDTFNLRKHSIPDQNGWLQTHLTVSSGAKGISKLEKTFSRPVVILQTMAIVVLLIVCGNIANLLLAKASRRQGELAMRSALGAPRNRIFQQVIVEGLLLGFLGSAAGIFLGWLTLRLLFHITPDSDIFHLALAARMNWQIVFAVIATGFFASFVFSSAPAALSTRINLLRSIHGKSGTVSASGGLRRVLVVVQIALSLSLLICSTVFACNLYHLLTIDPGFATTHVLTFTVDPVQMGKTPLQANQEYTSIASEIQRLPDVQSVVYARNGLLSGDETGSNITVSGHAMNYRDHSPDLNMVSPGFFSAMQIPLIAGREFASIDTQPGHKAAIVDQAFVNHYFQGDVQKALAGSLIFGEGTPDTPIVGVIPTIRATNLTKDPWTPFVYEAWTAVPHMGTHDKQFPAVFYVRTAGDPATLSTSVRTLIHGIDNGLPIDDLETMHEHLDSLTFDSRLVTTLSIAMGSLALVLAGIGLYGVLAFAVAQRTTEIGIRIALGANRKVIASLITRQVAWLILAGSFIGVLLGAICVRLMMSHDVGLTINLTQIPFWLFLISGIVLLLAMALATVLPIVRATSVDPMQALRSE